MNARVRPPVSGLRHDGFQPLRVGGRGLDGELAQLVPQAGLTSAQTNSVIPAGPPPPACSTVAETRNPQSPTQGGEATSSGESLIIGFSNKVGINCPHINTNQIEMYVNVNDVILTATANMKSIAIKNGVSCSFFTKAFTNNSGGNTGNDD